MTTPHHDPRRTMPKLDQLYVKYEIIKNIALEIEHEFKIYLDITIEEKKSSTNILSIL